MAIFIYEGYVLETAPQGYKSNIDGQVLNFDSVSQWKRFIDIHHGKART